MIPKCWRFLAKKMLLEAAGGAHKLLISFGEEHGEQ